MTSLKLLDFRLSGGISARLVTSPGVTNSGYGGRSFGHRHSYYELHFVEEGECRLSVCGQIQRLCAGSYCLMPPYIYHSVLEASADCVHRCVSFELLESGETPNAAEAKILDFPRSGRTLTGGSARVAGELRGLLSLLSEGREDFVALEKIRALLTLVVLELFDSFVPLCGCPEPRDCAVEQSRKRLIEEYLNTSFDQRGGSALLAKQLGVSERQMNRIFQSLYRKGYQAKMRELRLETAVNLLENTDWSIEEIAAFVGYENTSSFFCFIKRYAGRTPGMIRRRSAEAPLPPED